MTYTINVNSFCIHTEDACPQQIQLVFSARNPFVVLLPFKFALTEFNQEKVGKEERGRNMAAMSANIILSLEKNQKCVMYSLWYTQQ